MYFAVTSVETTDIANVFQMNIVFWYIVKGNLVERFWGFLTPEKHKS